MDAWQYRGPDLLDALSNARGICNGLAARQNVADTASQKAEFADEAPLSHIEVPVATATDLRRLDTVRNDLLRVHRGLLEAERNRYEKHHGRIANNSAFLQLVINDPWFDWLRPMGQMVLMIDERTSDKKQPLGSVEAATLFEQSLALLKADAEGDAFQRLFLQSIQSSPELAVLVRQVAKGLAGA